MNTRHDDEKHPPAHRIAECGPNDPGDDLPRLSFPGELLAGILAALVAWGCLTLAMAL